jgi:hypothetical protein
MAHNGADISRFAAIRRLPLPRPLLEAAALMRAGYER